jgi:hypothetical protein
MRFGGGGLHEPWAVASLLGDGYQYGSRRRSDPGTAHELISETTDVEALWLSFVWRSFINDLELEITRDRYQSTATENTDDRPDAESPGRSF